MAGLLKHADDVFCYIAHRDGVYHPIFVESEGPAAASPLVSLVAIFSCQVALGNCKNANS